MDVLQGIEDYQILISTILALLTLIYKIYIDRKTHSERRDINDFQEYHKLVELFYGNSSSAQKVAVYGMVKYPKYDELTQKLLIDWVKISEYTICDPDLIKYIKRSLEEIKARHYK